MIECQSNLIISLGPWSLNFGEIEYQSNLTGTPGPYRLEYHSNSTGIPGPDCCENVTIFTGIPGSDRLGDRMPVQFDRFAQSCLFRRNRIPVQFDWHSCV
jgi:hypothetical protein